MAAIDVAEKMNSLEPREDLTERFRQSEVGTTVADQLFSPSRIGDPLDAEADGTTDNQDAPASRV
jgi:hypothetical protein